MDTRLNNVEQQLLATQKLAKDLDEFAARLRDAAQLHEAKLATLEAHCVQQDAQLLELKTHRRNPWEQLADGRHRTSWPCRTT